MTNERALLSGSDQPVQNLGRHRIFNARRVNKRPKAVFQRYPRGAVLYRRDVAFTLGGKPAENRQKTVGVIQMSNRLFTGNTISVVVILNFAKR